MKHFGKIKKFLAVLLCLTMVMQCTLAFAAEESAPESAAIDVQTEEQDDAVVSEEATGAEEEVAVEETAAVEEVVEETTGLEEASEPEEEVVEETAEDEVSEEVVGADADAVLNPTLDVKADLTVGAKSGSEKVVNYYTINYGADAKVEKGDAVAFNADYTADTYLSFAAAGKASENKNSIKVTTKEPNAGFTVYWVPVNAGTEINVTKDDNKVTDTSYTHSEAGKAYTTLVAANGAGTFNIVFTDAAKIFRIVANEVPAPAKYELNADTIHKAESKEDADVKLPDPPAKKYSDIFEIYDGAGKGVIKKQEEVKFTDGTSMTHRIDMGGATPAGCSKDGKTQRVIKLETTKENATIKVWWSTSSDGRTADLCDVTGTLVKSSNKGTKAAGGMIDTFIVEDPGTYYIAMLAGTIYLHKIVVIDGADIQPRRGDWAKVAAPEITKFEQKTNAETQADEIVVTAKGNVSPLDGADVMEVEMLKDGKSVSVAADAKIGMDHSLTLTPTASGMYDFKATLKRNPDFYGEYANINSVETKSFWFDYPLSKPSKVGNGVFNQGDGTAKASWFETFEADYYKVELVNGAKTTVLAEKTTKTFCIFDLKQNGLTDGKEYTVKVTAYRINQNPAKQSLPEAERTDASNPQSIKFKANSKVRDPEWIQVRTGTSTSAAECGATDYVYSEDGLNLESVRVYSLNGKGKIVPATLNNDGYSIVYTPVKKGNNFKITAIANVNDWYMSNGQDGFGLVATDRVVPNKEYIINNSVMAAATKTQYRWNGAEVTTDTSIPNTDMKIGLCAMGRYGVTQDNYSEFENNIDAAIEKYAIIDQTSLEYSCANVKGGSYNIIANATNAAHSYDAKKKGIKGPNNPDGYAPVNPSDIGTVANPLSQVKFTIEKNNTGYYVSYTDYKGKVTTKKYYYNEKYSRDMLDQLDEDYEYVGLFAARNADVTFTNIEFTQEPAGSDPAEEHDPTLYATTAQFTSAENANKEDYTLMFYANWNGTVEIVDNNGDEVYNGPVIADEYTSVSVNLTLGTNTYTATYLPDKNWHLKDDKDNQLKSYDAIKTSLTVNYRTYGNGGDYIYVSSKGTSSGEGTEESPLDIYTACKYAQPGQMIIIMKGHYRLTSPVIIGRGVDGTKDKPIYLMADPRLNLDPDDPNNERPVFDFSAYKTGIQLAGNYWYLKGFDVTNAGNGFKGITVNGSYNVVDYVCTYKNGNSGLEIARMKATDKKDMWPHDNLIKNCTSFDNSDYGYEDADGFAAKLTVGDNNVFDGCVAYLNADDGWDLYAKSESGRIGSVVIKNSVTYLNGWVHAWAKGQDDVLVNAGNGNGFKMGGENLPGNHQLYNSVSFYNKANGIESNSCPDIKVSNSVAFNNMGNNIGLYTSTAKVTEYAVKNFVSFRNADTIEYAGVKTDGLLSKAEKFVLKEQVVSDPEITNETTFYWNANKKKSYNSNNEIFLASNFKSLDFDIKDFNPVHTWDNFVKRNEDGTVNLNGFLAIKDDATFPGAEEIAVGGIASLPVSADDGKVTISENSYTETTGTINAGDDDGDKGATVALPDNASGLVAMTDDVLVSQIKDDYYYYTGQVVLPEIAIYEAGTYSKLNYKNWNITYANNKDATDHAIVNIAGKGSYAGNLTMEFKINPISLEPGFTINRYNKTSQLYQDDEVIYAADALSAPAGTAYKPVPEIFYDTYKLKAGKDFNYAYIDSKGNDVTGTGMTEAGVYTISVNGVKNFSGNREIKCYLYDASSLKDITTLVPKKLGPQQLNAKSGTRPFDISANAIKDGDKTLVAGKDYTISYINNKAMGKATAVITGIPEAGYCGTASVQFTVNRARLSRDNVKFFGTIEGQTLEGDTVPQVHYNGKRIKLQDCKDFKLVYTNEYGEEVVLKSGVDFKISPGNGYCVPKVVPYTVLGKGSYAGKAFKQMEILPIDITDVNNYNGVNKETQLSISWNSTGIKVNKKGAVAAVTMKLNGRTIRNGGDYRVQYTNNFKPGTATFRIAGKRIFKGGLTGVPGGKEFSYEIKKNDFNNDTIKLYVDDVVIGTNGGDVPLVAKIKLYEKETGKPLTGSDYDAASIKIFNKKGEDVTGSKVSGENAGDDFTVTVSCNNSTFYDNGVVSAPLHVGYNINIASAPKISANDIYNTSAKAIGWQPTYIDKNGKKVDLIKYYKKLAKDTGSVSDNKTVSGYIAYLATLSENALAEEIARFDIDTDNLNLVYGYQTYDGTLKNANLEYVVKDMKGEVVIDEGGYPVTGYKFVYNAPAVGIENQGLVFSEDYTIDRAGWDSSKYNGIIQYTNNAKAGKATVFLRGTGKYAGIKKVQYTISKYDYNLMELVKVIAAYKNR